jgi:putative transposase
MTSIPVADRLHRHRRTPLTPFQKLLQRPALMRDPLFADQPPVRPRHRGQGVMLVGIERDIFHLLCLLLSRLTPPSVSPTHTVTSRAGETQRFHAIRTQAVANWLIFEFRSGDNHASMITSLLHLLRLLPFLCGGHRQLALENLALRQQLAVYRRTAPRPRLRPTDRLWWVVLARVWTGWRRALVIVAPDTVLRWQRRRFREHWTKLSGRPTGGRPAVPAEIKTLITRMATANPMWGAPRIHGELLKLGIDVAERTVSRLMPKRRPQPSQTWRTFLANHIRDLVSIDFFTVPTARLRVLFVLVVLAHHRRRVVHFNVTEHPTAVWTAQQIVAAFPDDSAPANLLRDRDQVYGHQFRHRVKRMQIEEVLTAPRSPWQNPFAERLIGSIRRECLNHVLVLGERHLRRILTRYVTYYHQARTHLALDKDAPDLRPIELPTAGKIVEVPEVGGLHHRYLRQAA